MDETAAHEARGLIRKMVKAALGTLDQDSGGPYVSLVAVAAGTDGSPILLISNLARHTRNARADGRASLLIDGTDASGDPVTGPRLTLTGRLGTTASPAARETFLARHPGAAQYADFGDFAFWRLDVDAGHYIGGFGRIVALTAADLAVTA